MSEPTDLTHLDDPAFLDQRARLRELLGLVPDSADGRARLERLYEVPAAGSALRLAADSDVAEARPGAGCPRVAFVVRPPVAH